MSELARLEVDVFKAVKVSIPPSFFREVLRQASALPEVQARLPGGNATVAVRLTSESELRRLNRSFARHDASTDVLSFAGSDQHVGDLAIAWPAAVRQAGSHGHSEKAEVALLCVHGLLHLLGWDHTSEAQNEEMTRITVAALARSGLRLAPGRI